MQLPVVDADYLAGFLKAEDGEAPAEFSQLEKASAKQRHIAGMKELYRTRSSTLHPPRTLDQYYHNTDVSDRLQNALNSDQVITRYVESRARNRVQRAKEQIRGSPLYHVFLSWAKNLLCSRSINPGQTPVAIDQVDVEYQGSSSEDESFVKDAAITVPLSASDRNPPSVLVVSQLWLIRLDSEYPLATNSLIMPPTTGTGSNTTGVAPLFRIECNYGLFTTANEPLAQRFSRDPLSATMESAEHRT